MCKTTHSDDPYENQLRYELLFGLEVVASVSIKEGFDYTSAGHTAVCGMAEHFMALYIRIKSKDCASYARKK